jgi:hypothetical protein
MRAALPLAVLLAGGCATTASTPEAELQRIVGTRVAAAPVRCVSTTLTNSSRVLDDGTIIYGGAGTLYVTRVEPECPGIDRDDILVSEIYGGQICQGDLVSFRDRTSPRFPGPRCRLGPFTPYRVSRQPAG